MPTEQIETLLEKYYNGETSLEEESHLHQFFRQTQLLPDHLKVHAVQFQTYAQEQEVQLDKFLADDWLFEKIEKPAASGSAKSAKSKSRNFFSQYSWQMAASISLLLVAFWAADFFKQQNTVPTASNAAVAVQEKKTTPRPESEPLAPPEPLPVVQASPPAPELPNASPAKPPKNRPVLVANTLVTASASDRLQLVSQALPSSGLTDTESKKIIKLLVKTMNQDDNVNVRLAACEALYRFKDHPEARQAFIKALNTQTNPIMQIMLIDIVIGLKEQKAVPQLQEMMTREQLLPIVKYKALEGLGTLM